MALFVSRAGAKLEHALTAFNLDAKDLICADLGSNVGGFVDCLLQRGTARVYAVETGRHVLHWKLRTDKRVIVMERTNALHVSLPEPVRLITIDVAWTRQRHILPAARRMLAQDGCVITLVKPHYEAEAAMLRRGVLPEERLAEVVERVRRDVEAAGFTWIADVRSPMKGAGGNIELLALLRPSGNLATNPGTDG